MLLHDLPAVMLAQQPSGAAHVTSPQATPVAGGGGASLASPSSDGVAASLPPDVEVTDPVGVGAAEPFGRADEPLVAGVVCRSDQPETIVQADASTAGTTAPRILRDHAIDMSSSPLGAGL